MEDREGNPCFVRESKSCLLLVCNHGQIDENSFDGCMYSAVHRSLKMLWPNALDQEKIDMLCGKTENVNPNRGFLWNGLDTSEAKDFQE